MAVDFDLELGEGADVDEAETVGFTAGEGEGGEAGGGGVAGVARVDGGAVDGVLAVDECAVWDRFGVFVVGC